MLHNSILLLVVISKTSKKASNEKDIKGFLLERLHCVRLTLPFTITRFRGTLNFNKSKFHYLFIQILEEYLIVASQVPIAIDFCIDDIVRVCT